MSQPGTLPIPTPGVPTGQQAARLAAVEADGEYAVDSLPLDEVSSDPEKLTAAAQVKGVELPGTDCQPCSYTSLFRYADKLDVCCVVVGTIGAAASGAALPVFAYLFGKIE